MPSSVCKHLNIPWVCMVMRFGEKKQWMPKLNWNSCFSSTTKINDNYSIYNPTAGSQTAITSFPFQFIYLQLLTSRTPVIQKKNRPKMSDYPEEIKKNKPKKTFSFKHLAWKCGFMATLWRKGIRFSSSGATESWVKYPPTDEPYGRGCVSWANICDSQPHASPSADFSLSRNK